MPNRVLRDWTDSEVMSSISFQGEVLFTRLIMKVDDYGCYTANTKLIKGTLFPLRDIREADISRWIDEIHKAGLIALYSEAGKNYLFIKNFNQRLRAMKRRYPEPTDIRPPSDSNPPLETKLKPNLETESETETEGADAQGGGLKLILEKHRYVSAIKDTCTNITSLGEQLTNEQAEILERDFGDKIVMEVIDAMENYKDLKKKYISVYKTARNWCKKRQIIPLKNDNSKRTTSTGLPGSAIVPGGRHPGNLREYRTNGTGG